MRRGLLAALVGLAYVLAAAAVGRPWYAALTGGALAAGVFAFARGRLWG